jgi:hypothetical protein
MSVAVSNPSLHPDQSIIYGSQIDRDLNITDRGRRKMIARGVLPAPDGYLGGRAFWTAATYAAFKVDLLAGKHGRPRRPGFGASAAGRTF